MPDPTAGVPDLGTNGRQDDCLQQTKGHDAYQDGGGFHAGGVADPVTFLPDPRIRS